MDISTRFKDVKGIDNIKMNDDCLEIRYNTDKIDFCEVNILVQKTLADLQNTGYIGKVKFIGK